MSGGSGFRRRLTLTFVAVAAVSAGSLAVISFLLVKQDRLDSFTQRSLDKARLAQSVAESKTSDPRTVEEIEALSQTLKRRADIEVVVKTGDLFFSSVPDVDAEEIFRSFDGATSLEDAKTLNYGASGKHYFVVHPSTAEVPSMLFLFSRENLLAQLEDLEAVLWRVWLVLLLSSAVVGNLVARQTLRPIARAGDAATALAEGMLDTRLSTERTDEFGAWADSFNRMATALQEKIRQLEDAARRERRFTSDVAHELRTPLSALVTSAEMLSSAHQEMGPDARWAAERLSSQVKRMRRLVEELLEISRLEAGRESLAIVDTDLRDLIRRLLKHHGWAERVDAQIEDVEVSTDPRRLDRVIGNLVANAIEHGDGKITIRAGQDDTQLVIHVDDHGPGIEPEDEPRVFDRFYKSDPARGGGSGLGLAIARENARLLGGDIAVNTGPEATTFTARLPNPLDQSDGDGGQGTWRPMSATPSFSVPRSQKGDRDETVTPR